MELKDTVEMMVSDDYVERFKAEYAQLEIRYRKIKELIWKYENGTLDFEPNCSINLLKTQKEAMYKYSCCLEERAKIEGLPLLNIFYKEDKE